MALKAGIRGAGVAMTAQPVAAGGALGWLLAGLVALVSGDALLSMPVALLVAVFFFGALVAYRREAGLAPASLLFFFLFVASRWYPDWVWRMPTASFLVPLASAWLCCFPFASARGSWRWFRKGQLDQATWMLLVLVSLASAIGLILWALRMDYLGIARHMIGPLREAPRWLSVLVLIPTFALMNAFAEEAVYRGVLQDALERCFPGRRQLVFVLQASAFAAAHYQAGFPNGGAGYLMTFLFAYALGVLRWRSNGMLAPYLAHVIADAVIGFTLLLLSS